MARRTGCLSGLLDDVAAHDRALRARGHGVWLGAEPTYTDRASEAPQWLYEALGGDKESRAARMCARLCEDAPGAVLLRSAGRPYPGEPRPRWCFGVYARRDAVPVWNGPPDPLLATGPVAAPAAAPQPVACALASALRAAGWSAAVLQVQSPLARRVVFRMDAQALPGGAGDEPQLARPSVHEDKVAGAELVDALALRGLFLVACGVVQDALTGVRCLRVELPSMPDSGSFGALLAALAQALREQGAPFAVLGGFSPPVDATVSWTTLTPDPAVVEVNMAPHSCAADFHTALLGIEAAAQACGLCSHRLHYNGQESDSGGGGQITLGGARAQDSPFLVNLSLLPQLVRFFNRHPCLSYNWSPDAAGAASQGPRADDGLRESQRELALALAMLEREPAPTPQALQRALAPFLVDASGNAHRSELNVEKLFSDALGARGRQGLVEFRALRMPREPGTLTAVAVLLRAIVAMLASGVPGGALVDWGDRLHDRFSLPFYLHQDLRDVLDELSAAGLELGPALTARLLDDEHRVIARLALPGATLSLRRAVEFWPLIGDVASQERGGARLVDASTARVELRLRGDAADLGSWSASCAGVALPLRAEGGERGAVRVCGVRYRCFAPVSGLHPMLAAQVPLEVLLAHPRHGCWRLSIHEWRPQGGAYPGLPGDGEEARRRRAERCCLERAGASADTPRAAPARACGEHVLDLRWLQVPGD